MRAIREVLRLRFGLHLGHDQITEAARSVTPRSIVISREPPRAGLGWPLPDEYDDRRQNELLFPARPECPESVPRRGVDFDAVRRQLQTNKHVTLQLLWEEYRESQPGGYS